MDGQLLKRIARGGIVLAGTAAGVLLSMFVTTKDDEPTGDVIDAEFTEVPEVEATEEVTEG